MRLCHVVGEHAFEVYRTRGQDEAMTWIFRTFSCVEYNVAQASVPIELVHLVEDLDVSVPVLVHDLLLGRQIWPMKGSDPAGYPNGVRSFVEVHEINNAFAALLLLLLRGHFDAVCCYEEVEADIGFAFARKLLRKQTNGFEINKTPFNDVERSK